MSKPDINLPEEHMLQIKGFGWRPDIPDIRDYRYTVSAPQPIQTVILYRNHRLPAVYDQLELGSCTAMAVNFLAHYLFLNSGTLDPIGPYKPSGLFTYYLEREIEGTIPIDSGAYLRSGLKVAAHSGLPSEDLWPYDISKFTERPPQQAFDYAQKRQALIYRRLNSGDKQELINCLLEGYPFCFGFAVYKSFFEANYTGIVPMPRSGERLLGGHAVAAVGYMVEYDSFIIRNSWGKDWGQGGYFRMPSAYLTDYYLADDFWMISQIE